MTIAKNLEAQRVSFFVAMIALCLLAFSNTSNAKSNFNVRSLQITTFDHEVLNADLYFPKNRSGNALVVLIPGTSGLSDPFFMSAIKQPVYLPHFKGNLIDTLTSNRHMVMTYNQRGYRSLDKCVLGDNEASHIHSFLNNCVASELRSKVSLSIITQDTNSILQRAEAIAKQMGVPIVLVAFSEGMYHIAKILQSRGTRISALIGIGSPISTLSETFEQQLRRANFFQTIESAIKNCNLISNITATEIATCANKKIEGISYEELQQFFGKLPLNKIEILIKKESSIENAKAVVSYYKNLKIAHPINGWFGDQIMASNWSSAFFSEAYNDQTNIYETLSQMNIPTYLLYGSNDTLVGVPAHFIEKQDGSSTRQKIVIHVIPDLDHYLSKDGRVMDKSGLKKIVQFIKISLPPNSYSIRD